MCCAAAVNEWSGEDDDDNDDDAEEGRKEGWKVDKGYIRFASLGRSLCRPLVSFFFRLRPETRVLHDTVECLAVG